MFTQSRKLLSQLRTGSVSETCIERVRIELRNMYEAALDRLSGLHAEAQALSAWEVQHLAQCVDRGLALLDAGLDAAAFESVLADFDRWERRAQAEALTAGGPTGLLVVNVLAAVGNDPLAFDLHRSAAVAQARQSLAEAKIAEERAAWQNLLDGLQQPAADFTIEPLLSAAAAIEKELWRAGAWTPWPTLNEALTTAARTLNGELEVQRFTRACWMVQTEFSSVEAAARPHPSVAGQSLQRHVDDVRGLLEELETAVGAGSRDRLAACTRRLRWTLTELTQERMRLERVQFQPCVYCEEPNPPDRQMCRRCSAILPRATMERSHGVSLLECQGSVASDRPTMTANFQAVAAAATDYAAGQQSAEQLETELEAIERLIEDIIAQVESDPRSLDIEIFERGLQEFYQMIAEWRRLMDEGAASGALEIGMEHLYAGTQAILDSDIKNEVEVQPPSWETMLA